MVDIFIFAITCLGFALACHIVSHVISCISDEWMKYSIAREYEKSAHEYQQIHSCSQLNPINVRTDVVHLSLKRRIEEHQEEIATAAAANLRPKKWNNFDDDVERSIARGEFRP